MPFTEVEMHTVYLLLMKIGTYTPPLQKNISKPQYLSTKTRKDSVSCTYIHQITPCVLAQADNYF